VCVRPFIKKKSVRRITINVQKTKRLHKWVDKEPDVESFCKKSSLKPINKILLFLPKECTL